MNYMNFSLDNFINSSNGTDKTLQIKNKEGVLKYTLNPFQINTYFINNNIIKIYFKSSDEPIELDFRTPLEAKEALKKLETELDKFKDIVPTIIYEDIKNYIDDKILSITYSIPTGSGATGPTGPVGSIGATGPTGPVGPTVVSTDFGNIAELGSDGYIYVPSIPATQSYDDGSDSVKSVYVATTTVLTRTPTYNNGASGVGATLTSTSNGTMGTVDGVVMNTSRLGERVLVKNQASALQNGIYVLTTVGSATQSYVLTRSTDSDETDEFDSQVVTAVFGTTNKGRLYGQTTNQPTVGTSSIVYTQTNSVYISQQTSGTQSNYQIPIYTGTARQLTKGTSKFKYDYLTNYITINDGVVLFPATNSVGSLVNDGAGVLSWTSSTSGGGGSFIPLSGTEVDKPVIGDIEFKSGYDAPRLYKTNEDEDIVQSICFNDSHLEIKGTNVANTQNASIKLYADNVTIEGTGIGLRGGINFTPNITDLDYTQKIYVDSAIAANSGGQIAFTKTKAEIDALITGNNLVKNALYEITGVHPSLYNDGTTSGTTIYLRAISGNQLEVQGMGKFFNPKYNQAVDGFGIWENKMYGTFTNIVGNFDYQNKEAVTADNSATGILLADGMIQWVSGDWSTATSITGDVSSATATVAGFVTPTYSIGDKVIWGGYSWTNVNGNVGASTDVLNLNAEWSKNVYDTTNYNIAYDVIEYDYTNDMIIRRHEIESNVDIRCNKLQFDLVGHYGLNYNPISVQQFGNSLNLSTEKGQLNINVNGGYNESVNFCGSFQLNLTFGQGSYQLNLTFGQKARQLNLTFGQRSYQSNLTFGQNAFQLNLTFGQDASQSYLTFGHGAHQSYLTFGHGAHQSYLTFGQNASQSYLTFGQNASQYNITFGQRSSQSNLTFGQNAYQYNLTFGQYAYQYNLTFGQGAYQYNITFGQDASQYNLIFGQGSYQSDLTFGQNASQYNLTFGQGSHQYIFNFGQSSHQSDFTFGQGASQYNFNFGKGSYQSNLTFGQYAYQYNLTFGDNIIQTNIEFDINTRLNYNSQTLSTSINNARFRTNGGVVTIPNISTATYIYDNTLLKDIYTRPDGTLRLKYMNDSDVIVISDITD